MKQVNKHTLRLTDFVLIWKEQEKTDKYQTESSTHQGTRCWTSVRSQQEGQMLGSPTCCAHRRGQPSCLYQLFQSLLNWRTGGGDGTTIHSAGGPVYHHLAWSSGRGRGVVGRMLPVVRGQMLLQFHKPFAQGVPLLSCDGRVDHKVW